ncbi:MAG: O-antigen flippase [Piscirickettsiaceae bacterium CG_4_10_14_3_um_filter_44_349]|uniref:O-antigen translocase n=1 Tax=Shewanella sp. CG18_big_fil_WC_8_21_14_2_50_42_11 TaxID=1975538 RepID=UPI000C376587|nr:O-antigen translocase [Shewanella sp. CG18_big_fil_WC_8_21_14_2_50_42_11]PIP98808.1 MAG: O-antigen flippase [Shewanella sp. CG18_big_fil_WC_8_21_14_2_50_42_11]PIX78856.1 MAG: O-antigen flippase [Piscirickettsiaceae bacterium CG_4_10_14_3_um_filter_44_349]
MTLVKTSILSFIATAIKLLAALVINKAVAVYIGPTGLALVGQFQNFSQLVMTAAQGAINSGVTKYVAEYGKDGERIPILFSTASKISLVSSVIVGAGIVLFSSYASEYFLKSEDYSYVFVIFGFTIVLFVINNLLLSILNGLKEIKTWVMINIIQSIYSLIFTTLLIVFLGLDGALIALVTNQSVIFLIVLWMLRKHPVIKLENFKSTFDTAEGKKLAGFAAMAITSAATVPVSHLIIRNYIGETLSWDDAGYWQAIWYISAMYLMVVTTTLSIYYLPKLSEITDKAELRKELLSGYKIIMPIVIVMSVTIFLLKDFIIWLLFTEDFAPMRELFLWQLVGDVLKLAAWLIAYLMLAKAMTKTFITTEIAFSLSFVLLSIWFVDQYGLIGMSYSFAVNYGLYFIVMIYATKSEWGGA